MKDLIHIYNAAITIFSQTQDIEKSCNDAIFIYKKIKNDKELSRESTNHPCRELSVAIQNLLEKENYFTGTYSELLSSLNINGKIEFLKSPRGLSALLKKNKKALNVYDEIIIDQSKNRTKRGCIVTRAFKVSFCPSVG
ncbi:hypothetical protein VSS37_02230 [Candidatus Thiothrix sp. Deng01]|uniref:Uncharacterized protein n=1 Tax=Candidatus Thiothrix phosphatis TaxID=3112415 RepID=A0ABU6CUN7_9GAMM|nr:hypothetical protein [Candidatus Thiothrix sp. Deng01]MEB4589788.1 hypothetical protein [Candidatus Thiothrix sp. Deng01]